jgi:hypothetical protein
MKKMQEKCKIYNIRPKATTPPQTNFQLKRAATKTQGFSMTKDNTSPEAKANHKLPSNQGNQIRRQTQQKTSTPPEVENTRFHQLSLDTP